MTEIRGKTPESLVVTFSPKTVQEIRYGVNAAGTDRFEFRMGFDPKAAAGSYTYTLWINGVSADFVYNPNSTSATNRSAIETAIETASGEALWTVEDVSALSSLLNDYGYTYNYRVYQNAGSKTWRVFIRPEGSLPQLEIVPYVGGPVTERLAEGQLSKFTYNEISAMVDKTGVNQKDEFMSEGRSSMTFSLTIFDLSDSLPEFLIYPSATGKFFVYEDEPITGVRYGSFYGIIENVTRNLVGGSAIEYTITGRRLGPPIKPFGSIL